MKDFNKNLCLDNNIELLLEDIVKRYDAKLLMAYAKKAIELATHLQSKSICIINNENLISYLLYFFPRTYLANKVIFDIFYNRFFDKEEVSILDIGCGLAGATFAVLNKLSISNYAKVHITLNDINSDVIVCGKKMLLDFFNHKNIEINVVVDRANKVFGKINSRPYDIILMSYSPYDISDGNSDFSLEFIKRLQGLLCDNGIIIIIEPADKIKSVLLMNVRNHFRNYILAPCPHPNLCPYLNSSDWCYFRFRWRKPAFIQNVFYKLGCDLPDVKFSYIVIGKKMPDRNTNEGRVIAYILERKGKISFKVCSSNGISECMILKRDLKTNKINISPNSLVSFKDTVKLNNIVKLMPDDFVIK